MSYLNQLNRAIDFIEDHLLGDLTVDGIARAAGLSRWHFQRVFSAMLGESVGSYILVRRLSVAATRLVTSDDRIVDIAFDSGFGSHEGFARAFKRTFGHTPSSFRAAADCSVIPIKPRVTTDYLRHINRGMTMTPEFRHFDAFTAVGLAAAFTPIDQPTPDNMAVIPSLWRQLRERGDELPLAKMGKRVGVVGAQDVEAPKLDYLAGRMCSGSLPVPEGFAARCVPAGRYAVFTHTGPAARVHHTLNYIFGAWLPTSGQTLRDGPEFELYPDDYDPFSEASQVELCFPIQDAVAD